MLDTKIKYDTSKLNDSAYSNITMIQEAFNMYDDKVRKLIGDYKGCWIGYSSDEDIRGNGASGGIVTSLITHAISIGFVDTAIISKLNIDRGLYTTIDITNHCRNIISAQGSIYSPETMMNNINRIEDERSIVVALPCQINRFKNNNKRPLIIGLFCGHTILKEGIEFLLNHIGLEISDVKELKYRAKINGKTGILIKTINGSRFIPLDTYYSKFFNFFFIPPKCMKCKDQTAEYADISCGDAWLKGYEGQSIFMARTERGKELIESAIDRGAIEVDITLGENVIKSQKKSLYIKKNKKNLRTIIYKLLRKIGSYISSRPRLYFIMDIWLDRIGIKW